MARMKRSKPMYARTGKISSEVWIERGPKIGGAEQSFWGCIRLASADRRKWSVCATGRNPRIALAKALAKQAALLRKRKGAFRGTR